MIKAALKSASDQVVIDLEDSIPDDGKTKARELMLRAMRDYDLEEKTFSGKTLSVRINASDSEHQYRDVIDLVHDGHQWVDSVVVPKVDHPGHLWFMDILLSQLEAEYSLNERIGIEALIESASGSVLLREITTVTDRLEALVFGSGDYAADLNIPQTEIGVIDRTYHGHQWHGVLTRLVDHARAVDIDVIDGAYADLSNSDEFVEVADQSRRLGVTGKWCIHPDQIPLSNDTFTPSAEEVRRANEIILACKEAAAQGRGSARFEGKMIDLASQRMAEQVLVRAGIWHDDVLGRAT